MSPGYFALSGVASYDADGADQDLEHLPGVRDELVAMRRVMLGLGLVELSPFDTPERDHDTLAEDLEKWARRSDAAAATDGTTSGDVATLVVYCTGHGRVTSNRYRMVRSNGTSFDPQQIVAALEERRDLRDVVLILDTCQAEPGADAALLEARRPGSRTANMRFWAIGASRRAEVAGQRRFVEQFAAAVARHSRPSWTDAHLDLRGIVAQGNGALPKSQRVWLTDGAEVGLCPALPNPRFRAREVPAHMPLPASWAASARGVTSPTDPGFLFTGRAGAMRALRTHLAGHGEPTVLAVTGRAGTGKSALLGHLVISSHDDMGRAALPLETRLAWPPLRIRVVAGRGRPDTAVRELGLALGQPTGERDAVLAALEAAPLPVGVVLDQLDDHRDPAAASELIAAMAGVPGVRLVIALSPRSPVVLPSPHRLVSLDAGALPVSGPVVTVVAGTDSDVLDYLRLRLALAEPGLPAQRIDAMAESLVGLCLGTFEIAVAVADAAATVSPGAAADPRSASDAAVRAASDAAVRIGRRALAQELGGRAGPVLHSIWALSSYGEDAALTAEQWAAVATASSGPQIDASHVETAVDVLGPLLQELCGPDGCPRWRTRFAFREAAGVPVPGQFLARLPELRGWRSTAWASLDPHTQVLLSHGASLDLGGGRLIDDPEFLLSVPPPQVSMALQRLDRPERNRWARMWRMVPPRTDVSDRALLLQIGARRYGVPAIAEARPPAPFRPSLPVGWVQPDAAPGEAITQLTATASGPEAVLVTKHADDRIGVWDARDGTACRPLVQLPESPRTLSAAVVDGEALALVSTWQGGLWVVPGRSPGEARPLTPVPGSSASGAAPLVSLHVSGAVVVGVGKQAWVGDLGQLESGRPARLAATLDADLLAVLCAGTAAPVAWLVTVTGRVRRLALGTADEGAPAPFPVSRRPLIVATSGDGDRLLVADIAGGVHLRGVSQADRVEGAGFPDDVRAVAVSRHRTAVAGGAAGGPGWLMVHTDDGSEARRVPLDEYVVGVALIDDDHVAVARPSGLLCLGLGDAARAGSPPGPGDEASRW